MCVGSGKGTMSIENVILTLVCALLVLILKMHNTKLEKTLPEDVFRQFEKDHDQRLALGVGRFNRIEDKADHNTNRITIVETLMGERARKK